MVLDEFVSLELGIDLGHSLQRLHNGLDEEGHEAEFHAMLGLEGLLDFLAESHNGAHVDLVEGGEDGCGLLGIDQLKGDLAAERCEFPATHTTLWNRTGSWGSGRDRSHGLRSFRFYLGFLLLNFFTLHFFLSLGSGCLSRGINFGNGGADGDLCSLGGSDLEETSFQRRHLGRDLVGIEGKEEIADRDVVTVFLVPCGENAGRDGFANGGNEDWDAHVRMGLGREVLVRGGDQETVSPKASAMSADCSALWAAVVPTAVLALASRPA